MPRKKQPAGAMDGPAGVKKVAGTGSEQTRVHAGKEGVESVCDAKYDAISPDRIELLAQAVAVIAGMAINLGGRSGWLFWQGSRRRWPAKARKAKSLGHRLLIDRHTLLAVTFGRPVPLIRLLLEVGIFFI